MRHFFKLFPLSHCLLGVGLLSFIRMEPCFQNQDWIWLKQQQNFMLFEITKNKAKQGCNQFNVFEALQCLALYWNYSENMEEVQKFYYWLAVLILHFHIQYSTNVSAFKTSRYQYQSSISLLRLINTCITYFSVSSVRKVASSHITPTGNNSQQRSYQNLNHSQGRRDGAEWTAIYPCGYIRDFRWRF